MTISNELLATVKRQMGIVENDFDQLVRDLIKQACSEMVGAGVICNDTTLSDYAVISYIACYCNLNYGNPPNADRLERMCKQKLDNLRTRTGFTDWGDLECE